MDNFYLDKLVTSFLSHFRRHIKRYKKDDNDHQEENGHSVQKSDR